MSHLYLMVPTHTPQYNLGRNNRPLMELHIYDLFVQRFSLKQNIPLFNPAVLKTPAFFSSIPLNHLRDLLISEVNLVDE